MMIGLSMRGDLWLGSSAQRCSVPAKENVNMSSFSPEPDEKHQLVSYT